MKLKNNLGQNSILISGLLFLIASCTNFEQVDISAPKNLNELFAKKASRTEVMARVNTADPNIGVIFNSNDQLQEAFIFVNKIEFEAFTVNLSCDWHQKKNQNAVRVIEKGTCKKESLKYNYRKDLQMFELRWKK